MAAAMRRTRGYDAFLSFRGSDVRKGFVDHLYSALTASKEINVFQEANEVKKGENIDAAITDAIKCSRMMIPILSPDYATSVWCLNELSLIANQVQGTVIPLFYKVTPSQVRHPERSGSPFAQAFQHYRSSGIHKAEEIEIWKSALFRISDLSGWTLDHTNGYEAALVKRVVLDVREHCSRRINNYESLNLCRYYRILVEFNVGYVVILFSIIPSVFLPYSIGILSAIIF